ncbi:hypothetical protein Anapl_15236 [Anas platyrhynchos]|uniref:Uncharacterized protein n=1 Tax=Anas platyrhynchos TaxID=8839 RepID=R0J7F9_ANAPL|nr:hypothetical protein Anapl_15236 [Anas platyrhynchos]
MSLCTGVRRRKPLWDCLCRLAEVNASSMQMLIAYSRNGHGTDSLRGEAPALIGAFGAIVCGILGNLVGVAGTPSQGTWLAVEATSKRKFAPNSAFVACNVEVVIILVSPQGRCRTAAIAWGGQNLLVPWRRSTQLPSCIGTHYFYMTSLSVQDLHSSQLWRSRDVLVVRTWCCGGLDASREPITSCKAVPALSDLKSGSIASSLEAVESANCKAAPSRSLPELSSFTPH